MCFIKKYAPLCDHQWKNNVIVIQGDYYDKKRNCRQISMVGTVAIGKEGFSLN